MKGFLFFLAGLLLVCQTDAAAKNKSKKAKEVVWVIDAGHGGDDKGCLSPPPYEKTVNLEVAKEVARLVKANISGVNVVLTRESDKEYPKPKERCNIANKKDAELFISIHVNSTEKPSPLTHGTETYYYHPQDKNKKAQKEDPRERQSKLLALLIQRRYLAHGREAHSSDETVRDILGRLGVKWKNLAVIRDTKMPAVLTEIGFMGNLGDRGFIISKAGQKEIAQAIYEGLKEWKEMFDRGDDPKTALNNSLKQVPPFATNKSKNKGNTQKRVDPKKKEDPKEVTDSDDVVITDSVKEGVVQEDSLYFAVQLMSLSRPIPENDASLKGLKGVRCLPYEGRYILIYGHSDNYADIRKELEEVKKEEDFSGAFIVAFRNGEKLSREDFGKLVDNGTDVKPQQAKPQAKTQAKPQVNNKSKAKKSR